VAFAINEATFLISAALVSVVKHRSEASEQSEGVSILKRTVEGFRLLNRRSSE
jgi:hypothetical protein